MSLDETAQQALNKIAEIRTKLGKMAQNCEDILFKRTIGEETIEFSSEIEETLWTDYGAKKSELQMLVDELP